ncbi:MAG: phosphate uptake regulator PhoU [Nitrososphaeria archaeon]
MEGRKIQKVGYSTMAVSLPTKWVKQNNIKPGDIVFLVQEKDGALKVLPSHKAQREESEEFIIYADACKEQGMLKRIIIGSYLLGHDVIRITSSNRIEKTHIDEVREVIPKLIGLGILEETSNSILLQCSIDPSKFKLDMLIRRLSIISATILSETMQSLFENNKSLAEEAISREEGANTIYFLAVRLLILAQAKPEIAEQIGIEDIVLIPATRLILQCLELIADYSQDIAKKVILLQSNEKTLSQDVIQRIYHLGELVLTVFQKAVDCAFTRNLEIANNLLRISDDIYVETERLIRELPAVPYLRAIVSSLNKISDMGAIIAELAINGALREPNKYVENIVKSVKHERIIPLQAKKGK